ncbi:MAG: hypothetical protein U0939_25280 [Pirellulales bacterium]
MTACPSLEEIRDLRDLRRFVHGRICHHYQLEFGAFVMTERVLTRGGRPCGLFFCVHGPRSVKLTAIWESERNTILFYGSAGERVERTQLTASPEIAP